MCLALWQTAKKIAGENHGVPNSKQAMGYNGIKATVSHWL